MKIPASVDRSDGDFAKWFSVAEELSIKYGIFVEVILTRREYSIWIDRVQFKVMEHHFESLNALQKALDNKIFL
jgi:hypothetical protein